MKKNKKQNKVGKVFGIAFSILLVAATMYLLFNIIKLNVLPTKLLFLMTIVFVLLDLIFILLLCFATKGFVSKLKDQGILFKFYTVMRKEKLFQ